MKTILALAAVAALCTVTEAGTVPKKAVPARFVEEAKAEVAKMMVNGTLAGTTCGGNCPSADCPSCPCGTATSYQDIASMCAKYSGWNQAACQCIMKHESSGNAHAANYNTNGSFDIGLWQINSINWSSCSGGAAPCDVSIVCVFHVPCFVSCLLVWFSS